MMYAENSRRSNPLMPVMILGLLAVIVMIVANASVAQYIGALFNSHSDKHSLANEVRNCPKDNIGLILLNPATNRHVIVCQFRKDEWGRYVVEEDADGIHREVTSFADSTRPAMNEIGHVVRNLVSGGYTKVEYITPLVASAAAEALAR